MKQTLGDYWRIERINYRGKTEPWDLSKQFLRGTQDELITHSISEMNAKTNK